MYTACLLNRLDHELHSLHASVVPVTSCVKAMREKVEWVQEAERRLQDMTSMGQDAETIQRQIKELKVRATCRN